MPAGRERRMAEGRSHASSIFEISRQGACRPASDKSRVAFVDQGQITVFDNQVGAECGFEPVRAHRLPGSASGERPGAHAVTVQMKRRDHKLIQAVPDRERLWMRKVKYPISLWQWRSSRNAAENATAKRDGPDCVDYFVDVSTSELTTALVEAVRGWLPGLAPFLWRTQAVMFTTVFVHVQLENGGLRGSLEIIDHFSNGFRAHLPRNALPTSGGTWLGLPMNFW